MSTEAVIDGGAPAPAAPAVAPIPDAQVTPPNPLGPQTPVPEKVEAKPETAKTPRDAVATAMEKVKERQAAEAAAKDAPKPSEAKDAPKPEAKAVEPAKPTTERAPDGKFAAKQPDPAQPVAQPQQPATQQQGIHEAPQRLDAAAKADWANAPESVKGAVHRTFREMETGLEEHRQRWEPIKQYDEMAKQYGTDLPSALQRYVAMDQLLGQDLAQGVDSIIRDKTGGQMGLREFIGQLTGQRPDQAQSQNDATIYALQQEITRLQQAVGGVTEHIQQQSSKAIETDVVAFSKDKPDFEALAPKIAEHISAGQDLPTAYETARQEMADIARQLGFVPASTQQQPLSPAPQAQPLKPAGQKSISGAPSSGSDPASMKKAPAPSIREALQRAAARV